MKKPVRNNERGQGLVEFALVLIILLVIIMVIVDLSRAIFYYTVLHNAAREGARYGITHPNATTDEVITASQQLSTGIVYKSTQVVWPTEDIIRVTLEYSFRPATPVLALLKGSASFGEFTLRAQATMNIER